MKRNILKDLFEGFLRPGGFAVMAAGILLPMGPISHYFKMQAFPLAFFPIVAVILVGYMTSTAMKGLYTRR